MTSQLSGLRYIKRIIPCLFILFSILHTFQVKAEQKNPFNSVLPMQSSSYNEGSFAPIINPVFSDISRDFSMTYIIQRNDDKNNPDHYFLLDYSGFLLSYSRINNLFNYSTSSVESPGSNIFTIGKGLFFDNIFGVGLNYSFSTNSHYNNYRSLTAGLILRPISFLSFGYVARDFYGKDTGRTDVYSLSIRPIKNITLSSDLEKHENYKITGSNIFFSANLLFIYGISIYATLSLNKDLGFGFSMPFSINQGNSSTLITEGSFSNRDIKSENICITLTKSKPGSSVITSDRFLKIILNGSISEVKIENLFESKIIFHDILNSIKTAAIDKSVKGIILQIDKTDIGFAQIQELREEIKLFTKSGKETYALLNAMGNKEYYLASACSRIYYTPANLFSITGLKAEIFFFKQGLDKIGIKFEAVKRGAYKSMPEPYTREHMSNEFKENITSMLSDLNGQYLADIKTDRSISDKQIDGIFKTGYLTPEEAVKSGFIDETAYPMDLEKKLSGRIVALDEYIEEKYLNPEWGPRPEIAVIYVSGSIVHGSGDGFNLSASVISDNTYYKALNNAFKNSAVRAVVIRIDSGGGSAFASELMWHYLATLKQEYKKPVVFSFGNTAASGGYYISCTGDRIVSSRGTVTGSIGVVTGKLSLKELYSKLGINKDIIKMSDFADIFSESKDLTGEERAIIEKGIDYVYQRFTDKVAASRGISKEQIKNIAEGRIFTGSQAKSNNLIDNFGGIIAAIDLAKKLAGLKGEYTVNHMPESASPLIKILGMQKNDNLISKKIISLLETLDVLEFNNELTLYYCPYKIEIK